MSTRVKVLKEFVSREGHLMQVGTSFDLEANTTFYHTLLNEKFIEEAKPLWSPKNIIASKLARVEIAGNDYYEGDREQFTYTEAIAIEQKLDNGWRLPTRSEWALICEEFAQNDGVLDSNTLRNNLGVNFGGGARSSGGLQVSSYGYYWSSTSRYYLTFNSTYVNPSTNTYTAGFVYSVRLVRDLEDKAC